MLSNQTAICPPRLLEQARGLPAVRTAVVNAGTPLVLESVKLAADHGLIKPVLIGELAEINASAAELGMSLSGWQVIDSCSMQNAAQIAMGLARSGDVQCVMKGHIHTGLLLDAALQRREGIRGSTRPSHVFQMSVPSSERLLYITDAVVNVQPKIRAKLDIARNATGLLHALGTEEPKIALLSATEKPTPTMPSSEDAAQLAKLAASGEIPGALVDGPFAFDNAISPAAAELKNLSSSVAGHADVLLVPNIETGNALFKQMVYFMGATAAGVVLGTKVPIILTSRADPTAARLASAALAAIYAHHSSSA